MSDHANTVSFIERFTTSQSASDLADAVTGLIKTKEIHALVGGPEYRRGISRLQELASSGQDIRARLEAIGTLQRLRAVLKKKAIDVTAALGAVLSKEPPSIQGLENAKRRYYVASALDVASGDWVIHYVARELFFETSSDKSAGALAEVLLHKAGTVEAGLSALTEQRIALVKKSERSGEVVAAQIKRMLNAFRDTTKSKEVEVGAEIGKSLRRFVITFLDGAGHPDDSKAVREFIDAVTSFVDQLIRIRLSLVVDSELYTVLVPCRRWITSQQWSVTVGKSRCAKALSRTLYEGLRISSRQGITDQGLLDSLEIVLGSKDKSLAVSRRLADEDPGLPGHIQDWLRSGRMIERGRDSVYATENELLRSDEYVATSFLEMLELEQQRSSDVPLQGLLVAVRRLAGVRNLSAFGEVGAQVDFSPSQHVMASGAANSGRVLVVRPGVVRTDASGNKQVVIKSIVEPIR
jgi:hypothetical protein